MRLKSAQPASSRRVPRESARPRPGVSTRSARPIWRVRSKRLA